MSRTAKIVGGVLVLVVVFGLVFYLARPGKVLRATIVLAPSGGAGTCRVQGNVDKIKAQNTDGVRWHVINNCAGTYFIQLKNFRPILEGGGYGPVNDGVARGLRITPVPQSSSVEMDATADTQGKPRTNYKYDIFLGRAEGSLSSVMDPEYEIWP
jgi:hypothetical protein